MVIRTCIIHISFGESSEAEHFFQRFINDEIFKENLAKMYFPHFDFKIIEFEIRQGDELHIEDVYLELEVETDTEPPMFGN